MTKDEQIIYLIGENDRLTGKIDEYEKRIQVLGELNRKMFETLKETQKKMHLYEDALHTLFEEN